MEQSSSLVRPEPAAPGRIANTVVDALTACPAVSRIAFFGSIAERRDDRYSDIDMLCAVEGEEGPWQAAAALRRALPLRWHGCFGGVAPPSGRHWLIGESAFHSVDLAYDTLAEFDEKVAHGVRGIPVVVDLRLDRQGIATSGHPPLEVVSDDYPFTSALYATTKAMRAYLRGSGSVEAVAERMAVLEAARRGLVRAPRGGDPDGVLSEIREIWRALP